MWAFEASTRLGRTCHPTSHRNASARWLLLSLCCWPSAALQGLRALSRSDAKFLTLAAVPVMLSTDLLQQFRDAVAGDPILLPVRREELLARLQCLLDTKSQENRGCSCGKLTQEFALDSKWLGPAPQFFWAVAVNRLVRPLPSSSSATDGRGRGHKGALCLVGCMLLADGKVAIHSGRLRAGCRSTWPKAELPASLRTRRFLH